jgi:hypothetical protein
MQLHPAIEAAGVHSRVLMHGFPVHLPSMGGPKGGLSLDGGFFMIWN